MRYRYYNFFGLPGRVLFDDDDLPETCELYDPAQGKLVENFAAQLDILDQPQSILLTQEEFEDLLRKCEPQKRQAR